MLKASYGKLFNYLIIKSTKPQISLIEKQPTSVELTLKYIKVEIYKKLKTSSLILN